MLHLGNSIFVTLKGRLRRGREDCGREGGREAWEVGQIVTLTGGASSSSCRTESFQGDLHIRRGDEKNVENEYAFFFTFYRMSSADTAFKLFDEDRDGFITRAEFAKVIF